MNYKVVFCLGVTVILVGCSKKDEPVAPAATAPSASTTTASNVAAQAAATIGQVVTNIQAPIAAATSDVQASVDKLMATASNATQMPAIPTAPVAPVAPTTHDAMNLLKGAMNPAMSNVNSALQSGTNAMTSTATPAISTSPTGKSLSLADLSTDQVTQGLKQALGVGLQHAVSSLGQPGGFLTNVNVKIPLPEKLQTIEKTLRTIGQGQLADQCITTMNQAAEQAVPAAADVFVASLKTLSVDDAKSILTGPPDAATQFFRRTTEAELTAKFMPIVQQSMTKCGATAAYHQVLDKAKVASPFFSNPSLDLNAYVTGKAMDGLFKMVAEEEKRIRENPVARSTDLLKSVFGALQK